MLQRCAAHCASGTDIRETYMAGQTAVEAALKGKTDVMVGFECDRTNGYECKAKLFELSKVANFEQKLPVGGSTKRAMASSPSLWNTACH